MNNFLLLASESFSAVGLFFLSGIAIKNGLVRLDINRKAYLKFFSNIYLLFLLNLFIAEIAWDKKGGSFIVLITLKILYK